MTKKKQQHQDIRQETVDMTEGAAFEMYVAVLREAFKRDSIRGVAAATVSFITSVADIADECMVQKLPERLANGTIAGFICSQWAPEMLEKMAAAKS